MSATAGQDNAASKQVGLVAIGRNEGERLRRCLESFGGAAASVVYVDSGSTDQSVALAKSLGAEVVQIDLALPFTAARSRNAGVRRLLEIDPAVAFVQVVDGDCEVVAGWIERAVHEIEQQDRGRVAVICGRRRERHPEASVYNRLIDMEWNTPVGETESCGGDTLIRLEAFKDVGGYDESLIAGEEPEMCWRLRHAGWKVVRIDAEMTRHDASMLRFSQWWRRTVRSGHAYAEGHALHGHVDGFCGRAVRSGVQWALVLPLVAFGLAWLTWGASLLLLAAYVALWARIRASRMTAHGDGSEDASLYANYCIAGKFAELQGMCTYWWNRVLGRRTRLIEYKGLPASQAGVMANGGGA